MGHVPPAVPSERELAVLCEATTGVHNVRSIQVLLGHALLSSTMLYTHLDIGWLIETYNRAHPRAHWGTNTSH